MLIDPTYTAAAMKEPKIPDFGYNLLLVDVDKNTNGTLKVVEINKSSGKPKGSDEERSEKLGVKKGIEPKEIKREWLKSVRHFFYVSCNS